MSKNRQPRIALVRHGRSALSFRNGDWIDATEVERLRTAYDVAGIGADDHPSADLIDRATRADVLASSDLLRAVMSAERLAAGREVVVSPLLREADLEIPMWLPRRWPLAVWEAATHVQWGYRILRRTDASVEVLDRARTAAEWLVGLAKEGSTVMAVTHGVFRRLVARRLVAVGWKPLPGRWTYHNWSVWELHLPDSSA